MKEELEQNFTKYEIARILGARALQIAMDAPLLLKISFGELLFETIVCVLKNSIGKKGIFMHWSMLSILIFNSLQYAL